MADENENTPERTWAPMEGDADSGESPDADPFTFFGKEDEGR